MGDVAVEEPDALAEGGLVERELLKPRFSDLAEFRLDQTEDPPVGARRDPGDEP